MSYVFLFLFHPPVPRVNLPVLLSSSKNPNCFVKRGVVGLAMRNQLRRSQDFDMDLSADLAEDDLASG